jgi:hypothetical protein
MDQKARTRASNAKLEVTRRCKSCGEAKPITEFNLAQAREGYRRHECKFCESQRKKSWYQDNYDEARKQQNEAARLRHANKCRLDPEYRKKLNADAVVVRAKAKHECFVQYGGYICACCGETEPKFLTIDHVNNDGYMRRKYGKEPSGASSYAYLRKMGYPEGFQVLCMNCNFGKAMNGGICPHKKGSTTTKSTLKKRKQVG